VPSGDPLGIEQVIGSLVHVEETIGIDFEDEIAAIRAAREDAERWQRRAEILLANAAPVTDDDTTSGQQVWREMEAAAREAGARSYDAWQAAHIGPNEYHAAHWSAASRSNWLAAWQAAQVEG